MDYKNNSNTGLIIVADCMLLSVEYIGNVHLFFNSCHPCNPRRRVLASLCSYLKMLCMREDALVSPKGSHWAGVEKYRKAICPSGPSKRAH